MERLVHFRYESIGNFAKLLTTIRFEKTHSAEDISIWHERFDSSEGDDLFESFLVELFPEGKTIDIEDIETIMAHAKRFLEKDDKARKIRNGHIKMKNTFWVYFKPDDVVYPCRYAEHAELIRKICIDFFKDFDDLDVDYLKRFILNNFELASSMSTIEKIAKDSPYILDAIFLDNKKG